jgi:hypothetical protein
MPIMVEPVAPRPACGEGQRAFMHNSDGRVIAIGNSLDPNFAFESRIGVIQYCIDWMPCIAIAGQMIGRRAHSYLASLKPSAVMIALGSKPNQLDWFPRKADTATLTDDQWTLSSTLQPC